MLNSIFSNPFAFIIAIASLLVVITVHEFAHAFVADRLGDPTPRLQGRLTLNPIAHLDPLGSIVFLVTLFTGYPFGWGKPVQFDPTNLQNPKKDAALISLAGPASNLIFASVLSLLLRFVLTPFSPFFPFFGLVQSIIYLNIVLAVFNLIPIHPLDGGKVLVGLLPYEEARIVDHFLNQYGLFLLIVLIVPIFNGLPFISIIISPIIHFFSSIFIPGGIYI